MKAKERKFVTLFSDILDTSDSNMEEYRQMLAEADDRNPEDIDDDLIYDCVYDDINCDWENFQYDIKAYDKKFPNAKYRITGSLGLWDGRHEIIPVVVKTLEAAINKCYGNDSTNDYTVEEDQYGKLHITYSHHDGNNYFVVMKLDPNEKNIRFTKEVW